MYNVPNWRFGVDTHTEHGLEMEMESVARIITQSRGATALHKAPLFSRLSRHAFRADRAATAAAGHAAHDGAEHRREAKAQG